MAIDEALLKILVCPENKTPVALAETGIIQTLNQKIAQGSLRNRCGETITEKIDAGLIREDKRFLYPIREDIPIMLIDEAIELA